jgi:hypothetical protein
VNLHFRVPRYFFFVDLVGFFFLVFLVDPALDLLGLEKMRSQLSAYFSVEPRRMTDMLYFSVRNVELLSADGKRQVGNPRVIATSGFRHLRWTHLEFQRV